MSSYVASTFNAFAFAGAGWIFSKINHGDYVKEIHRHDLAMERLTKERDLWNQARSNELDRISKLHYDREQGLKEIIQTDKDLDLYHRIQRQQVEQRFKKTHPQLQDYYKPSQEMTSYVNVVKVGMVVAGAALVALIV